MIEINILPEAELRGKKVPKDSPTPLFYFKLVVVGPEPLKKCDYEPVPLVNEQNGFFLLANPNEVRDVLHSIIERACNAANIPQRREDEN